jgi:hypothetical protein
VEKVFSPTNEKILVQGCKDCRESENYDITKGN